MIGARCSSDWTIGGLLRYASGALIPVPGRAEQSLLARLPEHAHEPGRGTAAVHQGPELRLHRSAEGLRAEPGGLGGPGARAVRHVRRRSTTTTAGSARSTENLSVGRRFPIKDRTFFEVRAEFFNVFNRTSLRMPTDFNNNPLSTRTFNSRESRREGSATSIPTATPDRAAAQRPDRRAVPVLTSLLFE